MTYNYETKVSSGVIIYNFYFKYIISPGPKFANFFRRENQISLMRNSQELIFAPKIGK